MSSQVDKVVKVFRAVAQYPSPTSAQVLKTVVGSTAVPVISTWSQRSLERGKSVKFQQMHFVDPSLQTWSDLLPVDVTSEILSAFSPSEKLRGIVREIQSETNSKKKQFLEVWKNHQLWKSFDLAALDIHGDVYADICFGSFDWSPCEQKLVYIAERKLPKTEPFYKQKAQDTAGKEDGQGNGKAVKGEEHLYREDWGEQLVGKHQSVIFVCDAESETIKELEGIPAHLSPGQVVWTPDGSGVVGVAWETEPRRLGLIYCSNRPSCIFHLTTDGSFKILSEDGAAVTAPRFSPNGKRLVWLQRPSRGPHHAAHRLICCTWEAKQIETVVDTVKKNISIAGGKSFYGLFNTSLPKRCWSADSTLVLLSTPQRFCIKSYIVNVDNKSITELESEEGSQVVLDVDGDTVVCSRSSYKHPARLVLCRLADKDEAITWTPVTSWHADPTLNSLVCRYMSLSHQDSSAGTCNEYSAIYFGPESSEDHQVPLIVSPHGGPHSCFADSFMLNYAFFAVLGFGMLMVNYRGSIGAGQDSVEFLLGRVGDTDVKDVHYAAAEALKQFPFLNPNKMVLMGGSHGGFLVTHLSGQFPDLFKAVVARNPVIDIAAMATVTDIPDWNAVEAGYPYAETKEMSLEAFEKMKKCSPIFHVSKVVAPTLLMIGSKDKRVPSSQGIHYYYRLMSQNTKTKLLLYDDNHPLAQVPVEMDDLINTVLWFYQNIE